MKKIINICFILFLAINTAYATGKKLYVGGQLGLARLHPNMLTVDTEWGTFSERPTLGSTVSRLYIGTNLSEYTGVESGWTYYSPVNWSPVPFAIGKPLSTTINTFDILGKLMYPFGQSGFEAFGKLGGAYLTSHTSGDVAGVRVSTNNSAFRPTFALGFNYNISSAWAVDLSYTEILYHSSEINNPNSVTLGISYHI